MGDNTDDVIQKGEFGAVVAGAGVGKTALLVQLALNALLRKKNVLHISLNDPVTKVSLWYKEIFNKLSEQSDIKNTGEIWESILPHRFIMTFKVEGFSAPKLEERLTDITEQKIFLPDMVIIDGLPFDKDIRESLSSIKEMAKSYMMSVWFTATTHRHEETDSDELPPQIKHVADLFEVIIKLKPEGKSVDVFSLKGGTIATAYHTLIFDPSTMILKDKE
jgi:hypothetical protein